MRWSPLLLILLSACGGGGTNLCERFYTPYPDFVGERQRTAGNAVLLDAMAAYDRGEFALAAEGLGKVIDENAADHTARMYLASALLGSGEPYKAEMHLDFLERLHGAGFKDQVEWYNTLCWLCSGQYDRALRESQRIAQQPLHTYKNEARSLAEALTAR